MTPSVAGRAAALALTLSLAACSSSGLSGPGQTASSMPPAPAAASSRANQAPDTPPSAGVSASTRSPSASAAASAASSSSPALPAQADSLLPAGSTVLAAQQVDLRGQGGPPQWVILYRVPPSQSASPGSVPPNANLSIVEQAPVGLRVVKTVSEVYAQGPKMQVVPLGGRQAVAVGYGTGAHGAGLFVIRFDGVFDYSVVFDETSDSTIDLRDVDGNGTPEVVKEWSPYCQNYAASPRLSAVYEWSDGRFVSATPRYPQVIASDKAHFTTALQGTFQWSPAGKACLHASLAYLATEAGSTSEAQSETQLARQADPSFDVNAINKLAAGQPAKTS